MSPDSKVRFAQKVLRTLYEITVMAQLGPGQMPGQNWALWFSNSREGPKAEVQDEQFPFKQ